jgi:hypothetical protein
MTRIRRTEYNNDFSIIELSCLTRTARCFLKQGPGNNALLSNNMLYTKKIINIFTIFTMFILTFF